MSRPLRLEYPGATWHVHNRGVERRDIFLDDRDRIAFLEFLAEAIEHFRWRLHAYVLMINHYHLLIETIEPTLSRGMKALNGDYAREFNWRHDRVGHLFQGRFNAHLIDSEEYLLAVARYIVRNPVRSGMVDDPADWNWSSHRAACGRTAAPAWLTTDVVLRRFDAGNLEMASHHYAEFVNGGAQDSPWDHMIGGMYLGSVDFIERMRRQIEEQPLSIEHPSEQRLMRMTTIDDLSNAMATLTGSTPQRKAPRRIRQMFAQLAHSEALAPLTQIAGVLGMSASGAKNLIRRAN
jgi:REP element-mobilizing transposase RayT